MGLAMAPLTFGVSFLVGLLVLGPIDAIGTGSYNQNMLKYVNRFPGKLPLEIVAAGEVRCGGACACATCHVHVAADWAPTLHPATDDEEAMLDSLPTVARTSRLSCQIIWDDHLDGLELTLPGA